VWYNDVGQVIKEHTRKFKVCLLGLTFSTNNMGINALTAGAIKSILNKCPNAEIFLLDYGKEKITCNFQINNRIIPVQLLNMRFSKKFYLKNNVAVLILLSLILKIITFRKIKNKIISKNFYLKHIVESDIVASMAGGDSFSDIYGIKRFLYVSLPQLLVLFMGKDLVLLPQTIGPFKRKLMRLIARYILNRSKIVYSRDHAGLKEIQNFLGNKYALGKFRFCYDIGFVVEPIKPDNMDVDDIFKKGKDDSCIVGLNVSGLLFMGGYTKNNMFGLKINYGKFINSLIDFLIQKKNVNVLLVPHVFGAGINSESDSIVCQKIYNKLKTKYKDKLFVINGKYNLNEIKYIIGRCNFFIGSRMHACIAALSQNIPAISIAYSKKFFGVMQTISVESLVADPREMGEEEILNIINKAYEHRDLLREKLEQKIPEVKETILALFDDIYMHSQ
jgi:polysaccharide pyruvyl transferase WcaK-like protein